MAENIQAGIDVYKSPNSILMEAESIINGERRKDYGPVTESFQQLADFWTTYIERHVRKRIESSDLGEVLPGFVKLTPQDVANLMILMKVSRAQNGFHRDSYVDIAGYAGCAEKIEHGE